MNSEDIKKCPTCDEDIKIRAKRCRFCGEIFDDLSNISKAGNVVHNITINNGNWNPGIAAVLSFLVPGLGQLYKGLLLSGLVWFLFVGIGYALFIIPGVVLHVLCVLNAYSSK